MNQSCFPLPSSHRVTPDSATMRSLSYIDQIVGESISQFSRSLTSSLEGPQMVAESLQSFDRKSYSSISPPKRARTAFNYFFKEQQAKLNVTKQANPNAANSAAAISCYWKNLKPSQKIVYFQMAAQDKFRYYKEKKEYEAYKKGVMAEAPRQDILRQQQTVSGMVVNFTPQAQIESVQLPLREISFTAEDSMMPLPPCSHDEIALLASQLDNESIDILIKALL